MKLDLKPVFLSLLAILPSVLLAIFLSGDIMPVQFGYYVVCSIMLLAVFDFATVVFIEQYRSTLGALTIPALLAAIGVILMFIVMESVNRYFQHLGYGLLTPFVFGVILLIYAAVFLEKNIMLKFYTGINSIALVLLWVTGITGRVSMPF